MKSITFLLLLFSISSFSQIPVDSITGKYIYSEVVKVDPGSADAIFLQSKIWLVNAFKSANDVIQLEDAKNHIIIGKGSAQRYMKGAFGELVANGFFEFTIRIECKERKYRYTITDFKNTGGGYSESSEVVQSTKKQKAYNEEQINQIAVDLTQGMKKSIVRGLSIKNSDW